MAARVCGLPPSALLPSPPSRSPFLLLPPSLSYSLPTFLPVCLLASSPCSPHASLPTPCPSFSLPFSSSSLSNYLPVCPLPCQSSYLPACLPSYLLVCLLTYFPPFSACLPACMHAHLLSCLSPCFSTCQPPCVSTCPLPTCFPACVCLSPFLPLSASLPVPPHSLPVSVFPLSPVRPSSYFFTCLILLISLLTCVCVLICLTHFSSCLFLPTLSCPSVSLLVYLLASAHLPAGLCLRSYLYLSSLYLFTSLRLLISLLPCVCLLICTSPFSICLCLPTLSHVRPSVCSYLCIAASGTCLKMIFNWPDTPR